MLNNYNSELKKFKQYKSKIKNEKKTFEKDLKKIFKKISIKLRCPHTDSNREPIDYKSIALPIEL